MEEKEEKLLTKWAEKIYQASEITWQKLVAFLIFPKKEEAEKFRGMMHGKTFGKFVSVFQSNIGILYLKIGDHEIATDHYPRHKHIEKIKNFLIEQGQNWRETAQETIIRISTVIIVARTIRGKILYPEIEELENEIAKLKEKNEELTRDIKISIETWMYFIQGMSSDVNRSLHLLYVLKNKYK